MKKHSLILTLLIFATLVFPSYSFAQADASEYIVRVIYFYPSDRQPHPDIDLKLGTAMKTIQKLYADNMERHGFGRKTFRLETDDSQNVIVHSVQGKFTNMHYRSSIGEIRDEISERFDLSKNIMYLCWIDLHDPIVDNYRFSGSSDHKLALIISTNFDFDFGKASLGGYNSAETLIAHELGHNFRLDHDFREDHYIMSYGDIRYVTQDQLSYCAAEWLDVHRYFNDSQSPFEQVPRILMHTPHFISLPNTIRLSFDIIHSERLHQAQLLTNSLTWPGFGPILLACKSLDEKHETIEFNTTELALESEYVTLRVIDVHGNIAGQSFPIDINALVPGSTVVSIPDSNLAAAIKESLGLASGSDITQLDLQSLRLLYADEKQITSLTGLEHPSHLEELKLGNNQITDITSLEGLTQLRVLILRRNEISDISSLTDLTKLRVLDLSDTEISDISPLTGLTQLTQLNLVMFNSNNISDISPLAGLTQLKNLWLWGNEISDISPLTGLTKLRNLTLRETGISDISPLTGLTQLNYLDLCLNEISDISSLAKLTRLRSLALCVNQIEDISSLTDLTQLTWLDLRYNEITDVSPLTGLLNLEDLRLWGNPIEDLSVLRTLLVNNPNLKIDIDIPFGFTRNFIPDQTFVVGTDVSLTLPIAASGTAPYTYTLSPIPAGLQFDNATRRLSGPPTTAGTTNATYTATDASGQTASLTFMVTVTSASITFNPATIADQTFTVGEAVNLTLPVATGGTPPYTYTLAPLPGGFSFDQTTRKLSGIPTIAETTTATYTATDAANVSASLTFTIEVRASLALRPNTIADQTFVVNGSIAPLVLPEAMGGTAPYTYTLSPIPNGLVFDASTRTLSGIPTTPAPAMSVTYTATDATDTSTSLTFNITVEMNLDVNGDGQVNVLDLVQVALFYGKRGNNLPEDVNANGVIDVTDLVAVANGIDAADDLSLAVEQTLLLALAEAAALQAIAEAPIAGGKHQHALSLRLTSDNVADALADARHIAADDGHLRKTVAVLERLLALLTEMGTIPDQTALLPNYPNPFNPETWIPYHLATDAEVIVTIYDVRGSVVRELSLGHQPASVYHSKHRAAYWDGRNQLGEPVASGLYFYTLTAGDFTATRKMLIRK